MIKFFIKLLLASFLFNSAYAEMVNKILINGNKRITDETIILFGDIKKNEIYKDTDLNNILKKLYKTDFFETVQIELNNNQLTLIVKENPIVQSIKFEGLKNKSLIEILNKNIKVKEKNSFIISSIKKDETKLINILKLNGYYFSKINTKIINNENNTVDLIYDINLGERAFIKNIKFIGDKKIKDRKLKNVIVSEESKFWKFISKKKYLDPNRIKLDEKLLKNYYKNNGYYNVKINSTSASLSEKNNFDLIFNINAGKKFYFNDINLILPDEFDKKNFEDIFEKISKLKDKEYSLNRVEKILNEIDKVALTKQYEFINATYNEILNNNKINLNIQISESEKIYVEKINIYGNYITNENVIRNVIITDEGDPFNEILFKKSVNNIKSKNIFSSVETEVYDGSKKQLKNIDITVEEKPTGEIAAGAGTGTSGSSISFAVSENNYLGKGEKIKLNATLSDTSIEGLFSISNPNFRNTDRSLNASIETTKEDLMSKYGYKTNKTGFTLGTRFEQYKDIYFSPNISSYFESLETSSKATEAKKKQEGDYFDTNFSYSISLNKLNQNFQPTEGYRSTFYQTLPLIADDLSISNSYEFAKYNKFGDDTIFSTIFFIKSINSLDDEDVRISNRIFIPSRKLRGFASGKVGPKDGTDYIGGNYGTALNFAASLPNFLTDLQNVDFSLFLDTANLFGVDYDSSLDSNKLRSSTGLAVDWFTPIGPLSFSFAQPITKASSDETEKFRFRIGTTF